MQPAIRSLVALLYILIDGQRVLSRTEDRRSRKDSDWADRDLAE